MVLEAGPAEIGWDVGGWLVERRAEMDRGESSWLEVLADLICRGSGRRMGGCRVWRG